MQKALKKLEQNGVIECSTRRYYIRQEWIDELYSFALRLKNSEQTGFEDTKVVVSESISKSDQVWKSFLKKGIARGEDAFCYWLHVWSPFFGNKEYYTLKEILESKRLHVASPSNTFLDRWSASALRKKGAQVKLGVEKKFEEEVFVVGDSTMRIHYPSSVLKEMDKLYALVKDYRGIDAELFYESIFQKETRVTIITTESRTEAEKARKEIKALFG
ncbi:MAG: hypothetical protein V1717_02625 [Candidatus Micrarchaeota archaeon]